MTAVGPVCHIPPVNEINQPSPQALPSIPIAQPLPANASNQQIINGFNDLANMLNQIRNLLNMLAGRQPKQGTTNNVVPKNTKDKPARWVEQSRAVETERVFQNNDPTSGNYVDVQRINRLTMTDHITGESWDWHRK